MDLKAERANSLTISRNWIMTGCSNGTIRFFKLGTLEHLLTLPKPPAKGHCNVEVGV